MKRDSPITDFKKSSGWIDSHCHLNDVKDAALCIEEAQRFDISHFIVPGTQISTWTDVISLSSSNISYALGTHPWYVSSPLNETLELDKAITHNNVSAVGEIGLDFYSGSHQRPSAKLQYESFESQLTIAKKHGLPVIIHSVKAHNDVSNILKRLHIEKGVIHAFTGSYELARTYVDLGFCLGAGPMVLKSNKTLTAFSKIPLENIVLETDSPFMMSKHLAQVNPLLELIEVAKNISSSRNIVLSSVQSKTNKVTRALFSLT